MILFSVRSALFPAGTPFVGHNDRCRHWLPCNCRGSNLIHLVEIIGCKVENKCKFIWKWLPTIYNLSSLVENKCKLCP